MRFWRFEAGSDPPGSAIRSLGRTSGVRSKVVHRRLMISRDTCHTISTSNTRSRQQVVGELRCEGSVGHGTQQPQHLVQRHRHRVRSLPLGVRTIDAVRGEQGDEQGERRDEAAGNVINAYLLLEAYRLVQLVLELPAQCGKHPRDPHVGAAPHDLGDRRAFYSARHAPEVGREVCDRHTGPRRVPPRGELGRGASFRS